MKLKGTYTNYHDVEVSPKEVLLELERLLFRQAGIQLVDKPTQRQLELFRAFDVLRREIRELK